MEESLAITVALPLDDRAICPKHGDVGVWPSVLAYNVAPAISISLSGLEGEFCLRCWGEWIRANIPELVRQANIHEDKED